MSAAQRRWGQFLERHRRAVAAGFAAAAVICVGMALRPPPMDQVEVPVAARSLGAGHRLEAADVASARVPAQLIPSGGMRLRPDELVGAVLAAPLAAGETLTPSRLLSTDSQAWASAPGTSPMPLRFADAGAVELLDAGQRLDILAARAGADGETSGPRAEVVAEGVLVLAVARPLASEGAGLLSSDGGPSPGEGSDLVVVAATRAQALAIAAAEAGARLSFVLVTGAGPLSGG